LSRITATFDDTDEDDDRFDDHTTPGVAEDEDGLSPTSSRLPSEEETRSSVQATPEPDRGLTRLATQMTVCTGTFLYQMPR
jgi:hypothetical protein